MNQWHSLENNAKITTFSLKQYLKNVRRGESLVTFGIAADTESMAESLG